MAQRMVKHRVFARLQLVKIVVVLAIAAVGFILLRRMYRPSISSVCDHMAELAPNSVVQPKIDRAFAAVPAAAKQTSPAARCEAYFTSLLDVPHPNEDDIDRLSCVHDAETLSSAAACLVK